MANPQWKEENGTQQKENYIRSWTADNENMDGKNTGGDDASADKRQKTIHEKSCVEMEQPRQNLKNNGEKDTQKHKDEKKGKKK